MKRDISVRSILRSLLVGAWLVLVVTGWVLGLGLVFLATGWPRWAFYPLLIGGTLAFVLLFDPGLVGSSTERSTS
ncbi:hypothetical protein [Halovivax gelatinilyticus]|uniref:hypothetical protein n=1 Tax=Halovivax gelatinilyticus TaxID=2961597 RepID=UPI0020CA295E|nr:hypothetical protein [Halovivax gelatinilyticus]